MKPEEALFGYLASMAEWESKCRDLYRERKAGRIEVSESMRAAMAIYNPIFEKYCSISKAVKRESLSFSSPPQYDVSSETIIAVNIIGIAVVEIRTNHATHDKQFVYRLTLENGEWRLFEKFVIGSAGQLMRDEL